MLSAVIYISDLLQELAQLHGYYQESEAPLDRSLLPMLPMLLRSDENESITTATVDSSSESTLNPRSPNAMFSEFERSETDDLSRPPGFATIGSRMLDMVKQGIDGSGPSPSINSDVHNNHDVDIDCESPSNLSRKHPKVPLIQLSEFLPNVDLGGVTMNIEQQQQQQQRHERLSPRLQSLGDNSQLPQYFSPRSNVGGVDGLLGTSFGSNNTHVGVGGSSLSYNVFGDNPGLAATATATTAAAAAATVHNDANHCVDTNNFSNSGLLFDWARVSQHSTMFNDTDILGGSLMQLGLGGDTDTTVNITATSATASASDKKQISSIFGDGI